MATVTTEPVAWRFRFANDEQDEWTYEEHEPSFIAEVRPIMLVEPLFTPEALATARAEGKAEGEVAGMFKAAGIAREAGDIANMLWNDNVDADNNLVRRDEAFDIANQIILAIIPAPAESAVPEQGERETVGSLLAVADILENFVNASGRSYRKYAKEVRHAADLLRLRAPDGEGV